VYDGSTSASVVSAGTLSGVLGSETVTVSAVANYDTKDVGTSKSITVVYTLGGAGAGNYTAPSNGTLSGSITPIQLIASTPTITKIKFVDGTTKADVIPGNITGAITGDNIAVTAVGNYDDAEIGKNKKITVVYALSGIDKNNYQKPTDFIVNDGEIKDFPPANLLYSPSSALSSLNIPMTNMLPSNTGGKVVSYSVNPSLPAGLTINATTGVISGTRTANVSGSFNYTVTAENSGGSTTSQITLIYNTAPSNIQLSKSELYESNAIGDEVGILSTTDIDANETHSYEFIEGVGADDNALFTVSGNRLLANQKFNYQTKNTYSIRIRVKDKAGLTFEKTLVVKVLELPKVVGANSSQYNGPVSNTPIISLGFGSQLQIQGSDIVSVSWSPAAGLSSTNSLNPIAKPNVTTTYTVVITHKSGSKVELKITVEVRNDYAIEPSTILTPNNDGYNDFWVIKNIDAYANNEVFIYDRNGRLLYNMKNYNNRWDGKINGRPLAAGTYYYIIRFSQQPNVNFKGFITIAIN
jgi:gliding motility-associated-like protein